MVGGVTDTSQVKATRVEEFRDVVADCAARHGVIPPQHLRKDASEATQKKRPFGHLDGLSVVPENFLREHLEKRKRMQWMPRGK